MSVTRRHDDRQIAGDSQRPQTGLRPGALLDHVGGHAQPGRRVEDVAGETLELAGIPRAQAQMVELHLGLGPCQCGRALEGRHHPVLVDQVEHRFPARADHRPETDVRGCSRARGKRACGWRRPDRGPCRSFRSATVPRRSRGALVRNCRARGTGPGRSRIRDCR